MTALLFLTQVMWRFILLLAIGLANASFLNRQNKAFSRMRESLTNRQHHEETKSRKLDTEYDKVANEFLDQISAARATQKKGRSKRESGYLQTSLLIDDTGTYRLREIIPLFPLCSHPLDITFVDVANVTYAICLSAATSFSPGEVSIGQVSTGWHPLARSFTSDPKEVIAFQDGEYLYTLVADSDRGDGTDLLQYSITTGKLAVNHVINSRYATALAVWKMKMDGRYHLAIANSQGKEEAEDLRSEIYAYNWMGTYFDRYDSFSAYDVKDIEPFHIHSTAYLAIASHRKDEQNYNVDSEILKFDQDRKKWRSHQKIRTYGAMDWEFFSFGEGPGEEFFLAVANYAEYTDSQINKEVNSVIYKFVRDKFVPFQCLLTSGAVSISALKGRSEFLLAVANADDAVRIYQYDGWQFVSASIQFTQNSMSSGVNSLAFHKVIDPVNNKLVLAVANSKRSDTTLYEMIFDAENSLSAWHGESTMWCMNALDEANSPKNLDALDGMRNVFYVDQDHPINIDGNLHFDGGLEMSNLLTSKLKDLKNDKVYDHSILFKLKELHNRLRKIQEKLSDVAQLLRGALFKSGNHTVTDFSTSSFKMPIPHASLNAKFLNGQIKGNYNFEEVSFLCVDTECQFEDVTATLLNGQDISNLSNVLVFLDKDQMISDTLYVESIDAPSITVAGLVDGIKIADLATRSGTHTITEAKTFTEAIRAKDVEVSGLVDGVSISPQTILLNSINQLITGNLIFTDVATKWLKINENLNGIPLDHFYEDIVFTDRSSTITGRKSFKDVVISGEFVMSPGSVIDEVDLEELWNNVMWKDGYQDIIAPINFTSLTLRKSLYTNSTINGIMIPGPEILLLQKDSVINAPQTFEKDTSFSKLNVKFINGLGLVHDTQSDLGNQLDILLKSYKQTITGHKTFHTIHLDSDSYVGRSVDGVNLSELKATALHRTTSFTSNGTWIFNNLVVDGPVQVTGLVSNINIDEIYEKALKLTDTDLTDFHSFVFKDVVHITDLESEYVNGLDISQDLVFVYKPQTLSGVKIFESIVLDGDSQVLGLVNDVDLSFLNDTLLTIGDQIITSDKSFGGDLVVGSMTINGRLNGVEFDEIVFLNGDQNITGMKEFSDLTVGGNLNVENLEVGGLVNKIDIAEMIEDTMTYEGVQVVKGKKIIKGTLTISEDSNLQTDSLNGLDLSSLYADAVLVDVPQTISGSKIFQESVAFGKIWTRKSIDGVTEWDMKYNWMTEGTDQEVDGNVIFKSGLTVADINVNEYINGINVTELNSTMVKTTESALINGFILFENTVIAKGDVTLTGNIQGIDLSEEAVLRSNVNAISGRKQFLNDIVIVGDLHVSGLIDGVSIEEFCEKSIFLTQDQNISRMVIDGDVTFLTEVTVDGLFGGIDVVTLNRTALKINEDSFISGMKTFDTLIVEGPLEVHGTVGGVDIVKLNQSYMSVTRDQKISSEMNFNVLEIKGSMTAKNLFTANGRINNVDIKELERTVLRTTGSQTANTTYNFQNVIFEDDLMVLGRVDGLKIPDGVMQHNKPNYILSPKIFTQNLRVLTDLDIADGFTIQGIDLSDLARKTVYKDVGEFDIAGFKTFKNLELNEVRVAGLVDNVAISENSLLLTYGDQTVTGRKTIHNNVSVEDMTVSGLVNGINLKDFSSRVVRKDSSNLITGSKYFSSPLTIGTLEVSGLIDGVDVHQLSEKAKTEVDLKFLEKRLHELDDVIDKMQSAFDKQAVLLQYYELLQELTVPGAYTWSYVPVLGGKDMLLLSNISPSGDGCSKILIHEYDDFEKKFRFKNEEIVSSAAVAMKSIDAWGLTLVFIANQNSAQHCRCENPKQMSLGMSSGNCPGAVYFWDSAISAFQAYQTIMMNPATDVVVFADGSMVCAVYTELDSPEKKYNADTKVYCAHDLERDFVLYETLNTKGARKSTIVENANKTILAVASTSNELDSSSQFSVLIYIWNRSLHKFGLPVQAIHTTSAQSVLLMHHNDEYSSKTFLIVAEAKVQKVNYNPPISVYKYEAGRPDPFIHSEKIFEYGVIDLAWIVTPSGELIFFALTEDGAIKVYKYQEASGFLRLDTLTNTGATTIHAFTRKNLEDSMNHYVALAGSSRRTFLLDEQDTASILKSKMKGRRRPYYS